MNIHPFVFNPLQENTYLIWDENSLKAAVIDPGMNDRMEEQLFSRFLEDNGLRLELCLQTHCHFDHILGVEYIYNKYGIQPRFTESENGVYMSMPSWTKMMGIYLTENLPPRGELLHVHEPLLLGEIEIQVLPTPGHTPGGVSFYIPDQKVLFTGDTLFKGSRGRTDLGGNEMDLQRSIRQQLLTLPADVRVYPGHGPMTSIVDERILWGVGE